MNEFELLGKEVNDICKVNQINFKWMYNDMLCNYTLKFKKLGKKFNLIIPEKDLYIKPFAVIKAEIEHTIFELDKKVS